MTAFGGVGWKGMVVLASVVEGGIAIGGNTLIIGACMFEIGITSLDELPVAWVHVGDAASKHVLLYLLCLVEFHICACHNREHCEE